MHQRHQFTFLQHPLKSLLFLIFLSGCYSSYDGLLVYHDQATDLFGFKDSKGRIIIQPQFERVLGHEEALPEGPLFSSTVNKEYEFLVPVLKYGKVWRLTKDGTLKFESVYFDNGPDYYQEGLARFIRDGKVGFHDIRGTIVIAPIYDFATPFSDGYSWVCNGCYSQYVEKKLTYSPLTSSACVFPREERYKEVKGGKWGKINKKGEIIAPLIYDSQKDIPK